MKKFFEQDVVATETDFQQMEAKLKLSLSSDVFKNFKNGRNSDT